MSHTSSEYNILEAFTGNAMVSFSRRPCTYVFNVIDKLDWLAWVCQIILF